MERIIVVDDDKVLSDMMEEYLGPEGYIVDAVHDGITGRDRILSGDYALAVLDVMLPGMNGFDVLRQIRETSTSTPIIMLTARGDDIDRVVGLEMGADDYLPKPFNPRELIARIRAVLRRAKNETRQESRASAERLAVGDLVVDTGRHSATTQGVPLDLTLVEFGILEMLVRNAGMVISRDQIAEAVLGRPLAPFDRSIDVHVSKLRKKLSPDNESEEIIRSVRGIGYLLTVTESADSGELP